MINSFLSEFAIPVEIEDGVTYLHRKKLPLFAAENIIAVTIKI